jgi:hypothetical protein
VAVRQAARAGLEARSVISRDIRRGDGRECHHSGMTRNHRRQVKVFEREGEAGDCSAAPHEEGSKFSQAICDEL